MSSTTQSEEAEFTQQYEYAAPAKMTRGEIVYRTVVDVRAASLRSTLRSDQCRALRASAEKFAERIEDLDSMTQQIVMGMTSHRGQVPEAAMLSQFIDEAGMVSEAFRAPLGPWNDEYGRDRGERPARLMELMYELLVRTRSQMDPKTRMAPAGCKALRDRCHKLAEALLVHDPELQDVVVSFCVKSGIAEGSQLNQYVDQARMLLAVLHETFPPPMATASHAHP